MLLHTIRLRGPWEYRPLAKTRLMASGAICTLPGDLPPGGRIAMPSDWGATLGDEFRGRVLYSRSFGCPTGLEAKDHVRLVLQAVDAFGKATLNDRLLGPIRPGLEPTSFELGDLLARRNRLDIEVELPELDQDSPALPRPGREHLPGGLMGEVRLEIHRESR